MHSDLIRAKNIMQEGGYTCAVCTAEDVLVSTERGVKPLLSWLDCGFPLKGAYAADKVIGKAAAMIYVLLGVRSVYAQVMSSAAKQVLEDNEIDCRCDVLTDAIRNRTNTGFCPMETAVRDISDPSQGLEAVRSTLKKLNN